MRRTLVLLALVAAGCGDPVAPDGGARGLEVVGDVTIDGNPAYGIVRLFDPQERFLASTEIIYGRYALATPVREGSDVCGGYGVRIDTAEDTGTRNEVILLQASSGPCVMELPGISHHVDLDLPMVQP